MRRGTCSGLLNSEIVYRVAKEIQGKSSYRRFEFDDGSAIVTDLDDWEFGVHREWLDDQAVLDYCRHKAEALTGHPATTPQFVGEWHTDPWWKQECILPRAAPSAPRPNGD